MWPGTWFISFCSLSVLLLSLHSYFFLSGLITLSSSVTQLHMGITGQRRKGLPPSVLCVSDWKVLNPCMINTLLPVCQKCGADSSRSLSLGWFLHSDLTTFPHSQVPVLPTYLPTATDYVRNVRHGWMECYVETMSLKPIFFCFR